MMPSFRHGFLGKIRRGVQKGTLMLENIPSGEFTIISTMAAVGLVQTFLGIFLSGLRNSGSAQWDISLGLHSLPFAVGWGAAAFFVLFALMRALIPYDSDKIRSLFLSTIPLVLITPCIALLSAFLERISSVMGYSFDVPLVYQTALANLLFGAVIIFLSAYAWYRGRSIIYFFCGLIVFFSSIQFLARAIDFVFGSPLLWHGTLSGPSTSIQNLLYAPEIARVVACVCISLIAFIFIRYDSFRATFARWPHTLVWGALVLVGAHFAQGIDTYAWLKAVVFILAFFLLQAENDFYDKKLDSLTSRASAIAVGDIYIVRFFMVLLVAAFLPVDPLVGVLLFLFFISAFVYQHPAFRLKNNFLTASLLQAFAALTAILSGAILFSTVYPHAFGFAVPLLAMLFGLFSNVRDYKDFEGDRRAGVNTLYVVLAKFGVAPNSTHSILSLLMFGFILLCGGTYWKTLGGSGAGMVLWGVAALSAIVPCMLLSKPRVATTASVISGILMSLFIAFFMLPML